MLFFSRHLRDVNVSQKCVSSNKKLILTCIGLFGVYEGRDFTISCSTWCEIQTFGFVNASILSQRKVEREVSLKMAEEIKVGGESSWCQGDCKPNRTRTVTAILESAMNKEQGQKERLSEHQFS